MNISHLVNSCIHMILLYVCLVALCLLCLRVCFHSYYFWNRKVWKLLTAQCGMEKSHFVECEECDRNRDEKIAREIQTWMLKMCGLSMWFGDNRVPISVSMQWKPHMNSVPYLISFISRRQILWQNLTHSLSRVYIWRIGQLS